MGIIICSKHGKQGIKINIDREITKAILSDTPIRENELVIITATFYDGIEFLFEDERLLKKDTFVNNSIKQHYVIRNESEEKEMSSLDSLLTGICGVCYAEYMSKHNIKLAF